MAFDAFFLSAVLQEIREKAIGSRVEKIHQPSRDTVLVLLKCHTGREKLLLAANPAAPRLQLTGESPENPAEPPMFCMLLRKHLQSSGREHLFRVPLIPGITDTEENLQAIAAFIGSEPIELLPYNDLAPAKYAAVGRTFSTEVDTAKRGTPDLSIFQNATRRK